MQTIVIGAGVLGASTAYHLARAGTPVVLIDASLEGRATAAGAGIICPWVSGVQDAVFYQLYRAGGEYYPDLITHLAAAGEHDIGYRRSGAMLVSDDAGELDWIQRLVSRRRSEAPAMGEISRLSPQQARTLFPPLRPDLSAIHVAGGARVDGRRLAAALSRAAQHHGAVVMPGHAAVLIDAGRVTGVSIHANPPTSERLATDRIPTDRVIVTAGAWADHLLQPHRLGLAVEPQRGQIVHLRLDGEATEAWPVILPPGSHYIVPFDDGRIVAGATRETGTGFDCRVTAAGQMEVLSQALSVAPGLGPATMIETRVGLRPVGAEARPILGWMPSVAGLAVGNGLGAAGLTIGPFAGRLLADLVLGRPSAIDLAPFEPMRRTAEHTDSPLALR